jgi:hypothetical protein
MPTRHGVSDALGSRGRSLRKRGGRLYRSVRRLRNRGRSGAQRPTPEYKLSLPGASPTRRESPYAFAISRDNPLEQLGEKYLPTKRTHNYLPYYWLHLRDIRFDVRSVLEIGVQTDRSIRMWEEFFPNALIHGMDIDPACKQFEGGRRRILIGDQGDDLFLRKVSETVSAPFDVIIDDGSHRVADQLRTFQSLFPTMSDHGVYVMEDTGGVVGDYQLKTVNTLSTLVRDIMFWPSGFRPQDWPHLASFSPETSWATRNVTGIAFYRWIVFVMRGHNPEDNPFLTPFDDDAARDPKVRARTRN